MSKEEERVTAAKVLLEIIQDATDTFKEMRKILNSRHSLPEEERIVSKTIEDSTPIACSTPEEVEAALEKLDVKMSYEFVPSLGVRLPYVEYTGDVKNYGTIRVSELPPEEEDGKV